MLMSEKLYRVDELKKKVSIITKRKYQKAFNISYLTSKTLSLTVNCQFSWGSLKVRKDETLPITL